MLSYFFYVVTGNGGPHGAQLDAIVAFMAIMTSLVFLVESGILLTRPKNQIICQQFNMRNLLKREHVLKLVIIGLIFLLGCADLKIGERSPINLLRRLLPGIFVAAIIR